MNTTSKHHQNSVPFPTFRSKHAGFILAGSVTATFVSTAILWSMYQLIKAVDVEIEPRDRGHPVEFVRLERAEEVQKKDLVRPKHTPPALAPPLIQNDWKFDSSMVQTAAFVPLEAPPLDAGDDTISLQSDADNLPLSLIAPIYPERARVKGIEGHCEVTFTITKTGSVTDARVDPQNCSSRLFHKSSIKAASKFKYTPRYVDGVAVRTPNVSKRITYTLE